eukprot:CAMPEP_0178940516 /NCGR_PEP_ID=MMETSP0789-20121207/856_1 /TAXON_ID=3005 /ORGANISM="Rhizosolenia setigera, Strain CCMP 1694" /LENGTH=1052 /DNA_ID=CAMNT_0020619571 /DNA_START=494 /DNA_END=3652 /DNA_ORIENTATION=+
MTVDEMQMALNISTQNCYCRIPAFALPAEYNPTITVSKPLARLTIPPLIEIPNWLLKQSYQKDHDKQSTIPDWLRETTKTSDRRTSLLKELSFSTSSRSRKSAMKKHRNYFGPVFSGYCNPGPELFYGGAHFAVEFIPSFVPTHLSSLNSLQDILRSCMLEHDFSYEDDTSVSSDEDSDEDEDFEEIDDIRVMHVSYRYEWKKGKSPFLLAKTRVNELTGQIEEEEHHYNILEWREKQSKKQKRKSMEGDFYDQCLEHSVSLLESAWRFDNSLSQPSKEPTWGSTLDPLASLQLNLEWKGDDVKDYHNISPSNFTTKCFWDRSIPCHTLGASTRCLLAALIRASTLHKDFLLCQLSNKNVLEELGEREDLDLKAKDLTRNCGKATRSLVSSMDFMDGLGDVDMEDLEDRIEEILEPRCYPTTDSPNLEKAARKSHIPDISLPSAPGRLMSVLCLHMAKMQTPAKMAALWQLFVDELRQKWDMREAIPNLLKIPGFDKIGDETQHQEQLNGVAEASTGKKADLAAFVHCSEPDPDQSYCLIAQKLQVFNIGVECTIAAEKVMLQQQQQEEEEKQEISPYNEEEEADEFFDTMDAASDEEDNAALLSTSNPRIKINDSRRGQRCPVRHVNLVETGDQLFAPYLQRPLPLTVDVVTQRKLMMMRQGSSVDSRILIAQRIQKPKLLSDMKAFKAANPDALFEDFLNWYGNPGSPFEGIDDEYDPFTQDDDEYSVYTFKTASTFRTCSSFKTTKTSFSDDQRRSHNAANNAMEILSSTRTFWTQLWKEADAQPASEQRPPLFDPTREVEMVLNFLETIHPSHLLNQMLQIKFMTANFILRTSSEKALSVRTVRYAVDRLQEKTKAALEKLEQDLESNIFFEQNEFLSLESISACEAACDAIGDVEVLLSRAISLLHKFPGDYDLVQKLLRKRDGEEVTISSSKGRAGILKTMEHYFGLEQGAPTSLSEDNNQKKTSSWKKSFLRSEEKKETENQTWYPFPPVEEYVLRNSRKSDPFQLSCVIQKKSRSDKKVVDHNDTSPSSMEGKVLLALNKCQRD